MAVLIYRAKRLRRSLRRNAESIIQEGKTMGEFVRIELDCGGYCVVRLADIDCVFVNKSPVIDINGWDFPAGVTTEEAERIAATLLCDGSKEPSKLKE